jgi:predicted PurR-regulated permease PerM
MPLEKNSLNRLRVTASPQLATRSKWAERRDIPIAILAWIALGLFTLWAASFITRTILVIIVAALLAYALAPAVRLLSRVMPRVLAILIVYLFVLGGISMLLYFIINTTIQEVSALITNLEPILVPKGNQPSQLVVFLGRFGITQQQITGFGNQIISQANGFIGGVVPLLTSIFSAALDIIIVAVLSIYLLIDGARLKRWIEQHAPMVLRERTQFALNTLERVVGGYIRGQLTLSLLIGVLVGVGMSIFRLPYSVLLGVLAFVLEFIPVLGTLTSGVICVLIALTQGWLIALGVLIYFILVHVFEGDVVGPRIVGKAVGLHPAVSLVALIAGAELFGVWGALLAAPLAGLIQALLVAIWQNWRETHPEQFPTIVEEALDEATGTDTTSSEQKTTPSEQEKEEILE